MSKRQPIAADSLPVFISLSKGLTSSFTSDFFCFGCLIWRAFASVKISSYRTCFHKIMRRLSVLEFEPFDSDLVLGSSRCERIIGVFIATLEFSVFFSSTNDNCCWFSNSMNWKQGLFLLKTMKRVFQLSKFFIFVVYFVFKILVDKCPGVKGCCSDCWSDVQ